MSGPPAHCVVSMVYDADDEIMRPGCVPHLHYAPCPRNGMPAADAVLHTDIPDGKDRAGSVAFWHARTHGQRPLVIHRGRMSDDRAHALGPHDRRCWCGPEVIEPLRDDVPDDRASIG